MLINGKCHFWASHTFCHFPFSEVTSLPYPTPPRAVPRYALAWTALQPASPQQSIHLTSPWPDSWRYPSLHHPSLYIWRMRLDWGSGTELPEGALMLAHWEPDATPIIRKTDPGLPYELDMIIWRAPNNWWIPLLLQSSRPHRPRHRHFPCPEEPLNPAQKRYRALQTYGMATKTMPRFWVKPH